MKKKIDDGILAEINAMDGFDYGPRGGDAVPSVCPTPVDELADDLDAVCETCGESLQAEYYYVEGRGIGKTCCESCAVACAKALAIEAKNYTREKCRLERRLHRYDPTSHFTCAPEEYEWGDKDSDTENAVRCGNRHKCTNYDTLLSNQDRDSLEGQALYFAIRARIDFLLDEAEKREFFEEEDEQ